MGRAAILLKHYINVWLDDRPVTSKSSAVCIRSVLVAPRPEIAQ